MLSRSLQLAFLGLLAGGVAFAVSLLFTRHAVVTADAISFADWTSRGVLGALLCATISASLTYDHEGPNQSVRAFLVGLVLGAVAGAGAEVLYELLMIKMGAGTGRASGFGQIFSTPISCATMGAAIYIACGARVYRLKRSALAVGVCIVGLFVILERLHHWQLLASIVTTDLRQTPKLHPNVHLLEFLIVGAVVAFVFSLVESMLQPPSLRQVIGQQHWKNWPLVNGRYLIGDGQDADIRVMGSKSVGRQQAHVIRQGDRFQIIDLGEGMTVNNLPVKQHTLLPGDIIRFGEVVFVYGIYAGRGSTADTLHVPMAANTAHRVVDSFGNVSVLSPGQTIIGRDKAADISISWDTHASRQHAKIDLVANEVFLSDLNSKNGTKVEGSLVSQPVRILPGNRFQVGSTEFTYLA